MTKLRSNYVCEEALATYAKDLDFGADIKLGKGEESPNNTILADVFEAFIAALYLDKGIDYTKKLIINPIVTKYFKILFPKIWKYELLITAIIPNNTSAIW